MVLPPRFTPLALPRLIPAEGYKPTILLEELKDAYGLKYSAKYVNLDEKAHKELWYLEICPNGKIPAIVDHDNGDFRLHESAGIYNNTLPLSVFPTGYIIAQSYSLT